MPKQIAVQAILLFAAAGALAQNGEMKGSVIDPAGAVIGNAYVLIHTDALDRGHRTAYRLELRTNKRGEFTATLPAGFFDLLIAAEGFTPYCQKVRTRAGTPQEIRITLKLDPLFLKEYGDDFGVEAPHVEPQQSPPYR